MGRGWWWVGVASRRGGGGGVCVVCELCGGRERSCGVAHRPSLVLARARRPAAAGTSTSSMERLIGSSAWTSTMPSAPRSVSREPPLLGLSAEVAVCSSASSSSSSSVDKSRSRVSQGGAKRRGSAPLWGRLVELSSFEILATAPSRNPGPPRASSAQSFGAGSCRGSGHRRSGSSAPSVVASSLPLNRKRGSSELSGACAGEFVIPKSPKGFPKFKKFESQSPLFSS